MDKNIAKNLFNNAVNSDKNDVNSKKTVKKPQAKNPSKDSKHSSDFKVSRVSKGSGDNSDTQLLWNMQADVRAIGKLTALENVYGFKNRTQALDLLFKTALKPLLEKKGSGTKQRFNIYYQGFELKNKPKAEARYHKYHDKNNK